MQAKKKTVGSQPSLTLPEVKEGGKGKRDGKERKNKPGSERRETGGTEKGGTGRGEG